MAMINTKKKPSIERADRRQEGSAGTRAAAGDKEGRRGAGPGPDPLDNNNHFSRGTRRVDTFPPADDTPAARQPASHAPTPPPPQHDSSSIYTTARKLLKVMERLASLNKNTNLSSLVPKSS